MSTRLNQLQTLLDASPDDTFLLFAIAKEYEKAGDLDSALNYYLKLKAEDSEYVGLYYHLGKLYEVKDQLETAVAVYDEGMQIAKRQGDRHALSELAGARLNVVDE